MTKEQLKIKVELRMESIIDNPEAQEEYTWLNGLLNNIEEE